jgi:hypothetical protein
VLLGLIVGLSESIELYKVACEWTSSLHFEPGALAEKPFLSDHHSVLVSDSMESFGFNSFVSQIVRRFVFSFSEKTFRLEMEAWAYDLLELRERDKLDSRAMARICVTCGLGLSDAGEVLQNWQSWSPQAIWIRASLGVAT